MLIQFENMYLIIIKLKSLRWLVTCKEQDCEVSVLKLCWHFVPHLSTPGQALWGVYTFPCLHTGY